MVLITLHLVWAKKKEVGWGRTGFTGEKAVAASVASLLSFLPGAGRPPVKGPGALVSAGPTKGLWEKLGAQPPHGMLALPQTR